MVAEYPTRGSTPWADPLKDYIDAGDAAVADAISERIPGDGWIYSKAKADGSDGTVILRGEIAALQAAGGGTLVLDAGTYGISDVLQLCAANSAVSLQGAGQEATIIKALAPAAGIRWGNWDGTYPTDTIFARPGRSGDFSFDGNNLATLGIGIGLGVAYGVYENIEVFSCAGDGWYVTCQNSTFVQCNARFNGHNGWTLDHGVQSCVFLNLFAALSGNYNLEIKQQTYNVDATVQPQSLTFLGGISEQDTGKGGVKVTVGYDVTFQRFDFVSEHAALELTPSSPTGPAGAQGYTARIVVRDCRFVLANTPGAKGLYLNANAAGVAGSMGGTNEAIRFEGWCTFSMPAGTTGILNGSTSRIETNAHLYFAGAGTGYATEGTGAADGLRDLTVHEPVRQEYNLIGSYGDQLGGNGAITDTALAGQAGGFVRTSSGADGAWLKIFTVLEAGKYTIEAIGATSAIYGKVDYALVPIKVSTPGVTAAIPLGTWDQYGPTTPNAVWRNPATVRIPADGQWALTATVNGRNASATNQFMAHQLIRLLRA